MNISIRLPRSWPGTRARVVVVVTIVVLVLRWAPGDAIPLGLGGWLGGWLTASPARSARAALAGSA